MATAVRQYYRKIGVTPGWGKWRFSRLEMMTGLTAAEIAMMVGLRPCELKACLKKDRFKRPVSILLTMLEQAGRQIYLGEKDAPFPMPLHLLKKK